MWGYKILPCIVRDNIEECEIIELQLIENIQRENITPVELKNSLISLKNSGCPPPGFDPASLN